MKNSSKVLIALGTGLVIGGVLGVLFAPDAGAETRRKMAESGKKFADKFNKKMKTAKEKMEETLNEEMEEA